MVGFDATRMKDISRTQLVSACRSLNVQLGADKSKATTTPLVADAMLKEGIVVIIGHNGADTGADTGSITRSQLKKAKSF